MIRTIVFQSEDIVQVFVADTFLKRFMGYMFRREPHYEAIMIKPCNSIHTFFMKFNIDVIFLNEQMEIIKKVEDLKPGKVIAPMKDAKFVIEARSGMFRSFKLNDRIDIR